MKKLFLLALFLVGCIDIDMRNFCLNLCRENNGRLIGYEQISDKVFCGCSIYIEVPLSEVIPLEKTKQ